MTQTAKEPAETVGITSPFRYVDAAAQMLSRMPDTLESMEIAARIYGHEVALRALPVARDMRREFALKPR